MGRPLDATHAKEFGIANIVVAPEDVDAEGLKAAREIAALPAGAVALSRALTRGTTDDLLARIDTGGLWVSEDQGDSWTCVTHTLPPVYAVRFA
jgi:enoyl-CoA hydratase/carnithine racemase